MKHDEQIIGVSDVGAFEDFLHGKKDARKREAIQVSKEALEKVRRDLAKIREAHRKSSANGHRGD